MTTGCSALEEEAGDSGVPARGRIRGRWNSRLENQDCFVSVKSANVQANTMCTKIRFFLIGIGICYFSKLAILHIWTKCSQFVLSCQLHGIVNLNKIIQGGLEIVLIMADIPIDRLALSKTLVLLYLDKFQ